jgi:hypothetical protein
MTAEKPAYEARSCVCAGTPLDPANPGPYCPTCKDAGCFWGLSGIRHERGACASPETAAPSCTCGSNGRFPHQHATLCPGWSGAWPRPDTARMKQRTRPAPLPLHRTEAGYPRCSTCDGGGCLDCTDPA